jgi:hypothetical protein
MSPGAGRRPLHFDLGSGSSFERLVFAEISDGPAKRVDEDQFVRGGWSSRPARNHLRHATKPGS